MKFNTIMSITAVALAVCASGCRYNNVNDETGPSANDATQLPGYGEGASDVGTQDAGEIATVDVPYDPNGGDNINDLMAAAAPFEDLYTRVTDVAFAPVYFSLDSTAIAPAELGKIDAVAQHLTDRTDRVVVVEGHCDERGSNEYNMSLGESRAATVRDYLVRNGIGAERIQTRSYGEERPAVEGHDEGAWSRNRRGEFVLFQM